MALDFNNEQIEHFAAACLIEYFAYDSKTQPEFKLADKSAGYDGMIYFYNIDQGDKRKKSKLNVFFMYKSKGLLTKLRIEKQRISILC